MRIKVKRNLKKNKINKRNKNKSNPSKRNKRIKRSKSYNINVNELTIYSIDFPHSQQKMENKKLSMKEKI